LSFSIRISIFFRLSAFGFLRVGMSLEHWFRLSQYLTLGLSCAALVFAEIPFLPELQLCLAPALALLLLAWWADGRWSLPNRAADVLGLLIAAGCITRLVTQMRDSDFVLARLPWYLALLPYMGPLSMAALLVKVFRLRDVNHFWHLQGWGLLQICLGCLLDGGPAFGAMMAAYLASDLVCLALHYRLSSQRVASSEWRAAREESSILATRHSPLATPRWLLVFTLRWTLLVSATTLLIFLLTPRRDSWSWEPLSRLQSGYRDGTQGLNEEMNLNNTGRVALDDGIALRVTAVDASGQPKLDLPADQRWRGSVLDWYEHGKWTTMSMLSMRPQRSSQADLPDFGPNQFFLTFTVQPLQAGGLVVAEPIRFGPSPTRLPVVALTDQRQQRLFAEFAGTVLSHVPSDPRWEYRYRQVVPAGGDPERVPAEGLWSRNDTVQPIQLLQTLPHPLAAPLRDWTIDLLRRLSQHSHYRLPKDVRTTLAQPQQHFQVPPLHWETVARALTDYLAHSGEYTYTLENTRQDRSLDPILDFLMNVKQGHCERYAAALTLMLRSVGIPARVVKGFLGCESKGEGKYVVRHSHAHAWVEILVTHDRSADGPDVPPNRKPYFDWLTLDATPPEPTAEARSMSFTYLWSEAERFCLQWWRALIVEYDGDEQSDIWKTLTSVRALSLLKHVALAVSVSGASFALWLLVRRLRLPRTTAGDRGDGAIYRRLVQILTRYVSLRPYVGQTPREYSVAAQSVLQTRPALAALAELPRRIVELFYRVRFGGQALNEGERQQIDTELDRFTEALKSD
jgi:hypothetical protein